jgi:subtilisin-like proprotein convertase family protein
MRTLLVSGSLALLLALAAIPAEAAPPALINTQGVLRTQSGAPVADGVHALAFALYGSPVDPSPLWIESHAGVAVSGGFYSSILGETTPLGQSLFQNAELWVGVRVDGGAELPRARLLSVAYAFEAGRALIATAAENVQCSGCIGKGALGFDLGSDIQAGAKAACFDSLSELRSALDSVYAPLAHTHGGGDITSPVAQCLLAADALGLEGRSLNQLKAEILTAVDGAGYLKTGSQIDASQLPADSLSSVSNGLLTNLFQDSVSASLMPLPIPDNSPPGISSTITFPDLGTAEVLAVTVDVSNSDLSGITLQLTDPNNIDYLLYDRGSTGTIIRTSYPTPTATLSGDLYTWVGKNPVGTWKLTVIDSKYRNNAMDGQINAWSIATKTLSSKKVEATGDLVVSGALSGKNGVLQVAGGLVVQGQPVARVWTGSSESLVNGAHLDVNTGMVDPMLTATAWVGQLDGSWTQATTGNALTIGNCTVCGDGSEGDYVASSDTTLAGGTHNFRSFRIDAGTTLTVVGLQPLVLNVQTRAVIAGTLAANGGAGSGRTAGAGTLGSGAGGAGGFSNNSSGVWGESGSGAGAGGGGYAGGGGGGFGTGGMAGGGGGNGGSAGLTYCDLLLSTLCAGSGGGGSGAQNGSGGGGGGGGGAIEISAQAIEVSGSVSVHGGTGGGGFGEWYGGGGGGSGGAIWLRASLVGITGVLDASGGAGGPQGIYGGGGHGGKGRIRLDGWISPPLSTDPPYISGSLLPVATSLAPFSITQPSPGLVRLTNFSGATQKVRLVVLQ